MINRKKIESVRADLQALKAAALEERCDMLCYLSKWLNGKPKTCCPDASRGERR
jgi:hypothetical protein